MDCNPSNRTACLYTSDLSFPDAEIDAVIHDSTRSYDLPIKVRYPIGAQDERPLVIWNHGGQPASTGRDRSDEWGIVLTRAGYVVIHPARVAYPSLYQGFEQECIDNDALSQAPVGATPEEACSAWVAQYIYGPQNTHFLLDNLDRIESLHPDLGGRIDRASIVIAGHSSGTSVVFSNAGVPQQWNPSSPVYTERNDAPIAFLASAPHGTLLAGWGDGLISTSFLDLDRPFLFISGIGDQNDEPAEGRTVAWLNALPDNKFLVWNRDPGAIHETMNINKCDPPVPEGHCEWIASAGLAFLDSIVRDRPAANAWLASDALEILSDHTIELHRR